MLTEDGINKRMVDLFFQLQSISNDILKVQENRLAKIYIDAFWDIDTQIRKLFDKFPKGVDYRAVAKSQRLLQLEKAISERLKELGYQSKKITEAVIKNQFSNSYYYSGYTVESSTQLLWGFGVLAKSKIDAALVNPMDRIGWKRRSDISITRLFDTTTREITNGLIQGRGYNKTANILKKKFRNHAENDMARIVRTESHRAVSAGQNEAFSRLNAGARRLKLDVKKIWISTQDKRTREHHANRNLQEATCP